MRIAKTYKFKKESVERLAVVQAELEKELGIKMSATATIEFLINDYHKNI